MQEKPKFNSPIIYKSIGEFYGHSKFKLFKIEKNNVFTSNVLRKIGFSDRMITNLLEANMIKIPTNKEIDLRYMIESGFVDDWEKQQSEPNKIRRAVKVFDSDYVDFAEDFFEIQPFFFDKANLWWLWNFQKKCWEMRDETDMLNEIYESARELNIKITSSGVKSQVITGLKMTGRKHTPAPVKNTWVQFKDQIYDVKTGEQFDATPDYFNVNPIPYEIGDSDKTPIMDKLIIDWVGEEFKDTMYEIMAYCCITDYPIHLVFCFIGSGRNGKTKFQQMLTKFIGKDNTCSTELDILLESKFESAKLFKKLVCTMGETNFGILNKTSLLKKLTGQDLIGYEFKNKNPFDDTNYAKIIINSNSLPTSDDTSEGFYRRWMIIDFPHKFPEGHDILAKIPEQEYNNLACKIIKVLPELLKRGKFKNQGTIAEREKKYILSSNPLSIFLEVCCNIDVENYISYSRLYNTYCRFLSVNKRRIVSKKEFNSALLQEGVETRRNRKDGVRDYWVETIDLKNDIEISANLSQMSPLSAKFQLQPLTRKFELKINGQGGHLGQQGSTGNTTSSTGDIVAQKNTTLKDLIKQSLLSCIIPTDVEIIKTTLLSNFKDENIDQHEQLFDKIYEDMKRLGELFEPRPGMCQVI